MSLPSPHPKVGIPIGITLCEALGNPESWDESAGWSLSLSWKYVGRHLDLEGKNEYRKYKVHFGEQLVPIGGMGT